VAAGTGAEVGQPRPARSSSGSTEVGRQFLRYSADSNLKEIVLECGGKSPQVVMADCRDQLELIAADLATTGWKPWSSTHRSRRSG
jgi:acyl-CoA reductase-like NAD-dependent aldehyde dehydrogenase